MAYGDDIDALNPDHRWSFENVTTDAVGSADGTLSSATLVSFSSMCEGNTFALLTDGISDRMTLPNTVTINNDAQAQKVVCGWFRATSLQAPPKRIYGEGDATQSFSFLLGWGNRLVFEVDDPSFTLQIFGDVILEPDRTYHLCMIFDGNGGGNELRAYLDGVEQLNAEPTDRQPDAATLTARSVGEFGAPAGTVAVGGTAVALLAPINGYYAQWAVWDEDTLTETEVREELFEKGALADLTITNQAGLDAIADTVRDNAPCCIRVTGSGTIDLEADNVTFDPLASIHVQYTGTGTVNWTNTNGANASIGSVTAGGVLNFINPATLTINGLINGAEVRIYDNETLGDKDYDTELDGIEALSGTSFAYAHDGSVNTIVIQMMKYGYEELIMEQVLGAVDQSITVFPKVDANI